MARPSPQTERVVALVDLLASRPGEPFTLAEVTRRLRVNKSTCHSMLTTLTAAGWLLRDPFAKTYRLGPALAALGRVATSEHPALDVAHAAMVDVGLRTGAHCAALAVVGDRLTVLDEVLDRHAVGAGLRIGTSLPLRPPFGSAAVAWGGDALVDAWLAQVPGDARDHAAAALDATRARGYAVELSTTPEARLQEMAARLRAPDGSVSISDLVEHLARDLAPRDDVLPLALDPAGEYTLSAVNAPVLDPDGRIALVLSLTGFARPMTGAEVAAVGDRLTGATGTLTSALAGGGAMRRGG